MGQGRLPPTRQSSLAQGHGERSLHTLSPTEDQCKKPSRAPWLWSRKGPRIPHTTARRSYFPWAFE